MSNLLNYKQRFNNLLTKNKGIIREREGITQDEQAINFFREIYGHTKQKIMIYAGLDTDEETNTLLYGIYGCGKTEMGKIIAKKCNDVLFFDFSTNSSSAGLIEYLDQHKHQKPRVLWIEEIGMAKSNDVDALRSVLEGRRIIKDLKGKHYDIDLSGCKIFATTNDLELKKPIKNRWAIIEFKEYTDEEFIKVCQFCLMDKFTPEISGLIAQVFLDKGIKEVRQVKQAAYRIPKGANEDMIVSRVEMFIEITPKEEINYN
jgi:Holliday junction resolvasome RuvABC ATP-dependent DNA helicase subunit